MRYQTIRLSIPMKGHTLPALLLRPGKRPSAPVPGVLWLHGGGYMTGMAEMAHFTRARDLAGRCGAVVLAPGYRLSLRHPYPAALEDAWRALKFLVRNAGPLGVDPARIMVGGESAGGGLTAALCMLARDRGEVRVAFQMPIYPMLDDRDTLSSRNNHAPVWNTRRNHAAWKQYLKGLEGEPPAYAAPARQTDYAGLPPAYTFVGTDDPFYRETLDYVKKLREAGVKARADVYPGCFHAFDMMAPWKPESREAARRFEAAFRYAAAHFTVPQPLEGRSAPQDVPGQEE